MTEQKTNATEITRLLQKPQKSTQKKIKLTTYTFIRSNKKKTITGDSAPPSPTSLSRSPSPLKKRIKTTIKSVKPTTQSDKNSKLHSRLSKYFTSKFTYQPKKKETVVNSKLYCKCESDSENSSIVPFIPSSEKSNRASVILVGTTSGPCSLNHRSRNCPDPNFCASETSSTSSLRELESDELIGFGKKSQKGKERVDQDEKYKKQKKKVKCRCEEKESSKSDISTSSPSSEYPAPTSKKKTSVKRFDKTKKESTKGENKQRNTKHSSENKQKAGEKSSSIYRFSKKSKKTSKNKTADLSAKCDCPETSSSSVDSTSLDSSMDDEKTGSEGSSDTPESTYDPHMHRTVEKPTTNAETLVHLIKCSIGTGILAMPQAFANSGFILGVIFTVIIGVIITHCLRTLVQSQYILCKRRRVPLLTYSESMAAALETGPICLRRFSKSSGILVNVFLIVLQLGVCCVYIVFIAGTLKKIVDPLCVMRIELHMAIILGPLILANCIPNLKMLAPFSAVANILIALSLGITMYFLLTGTKKSTEAIDLWGSIYTFPLFFGTTLFALTAVAVVTTLENNMKTPKDFTKPLGVLNIGMTIVVSIYVTLGVIGYLFCKSKCSDTIALDLPCTNPAVTVMLLMYAIGILISYVLQCYVPVEIIWRTLFKQRLMNSSQAKQKFWEYGLRIFLCLLTFFFAVEIRRLGLFVALFGIAVLGIMLPAVLEICVTLSFDFSTTKYLIIIKDIFLIAIGLSALFVFGTAAVIEILTRFKKSKCHS